MLNAKNIVRYVSPYPARVVAAPPQLDTHSFPASSRISGTNITKQTGATSSSAQVSVNARATKEGWHQCWWAAHQRRGGVLLEGERVSDIANRVESDHCISVLDHLPSKVELGVQCNATNQIDVPRNDHSTISEQKREPARKREDAIGEFLHGKFDSPYHEHDAERKGEKRLSNLYRLLVPSNIKPNQKGDSD
eukprot:888151_1